MKNNLLFAIEVLNDNNFLTEEFKKELPNVSLSTVWDSVKQDILSKKVEDVINRIVPTCFKIGDKVFLQGKTKGDIDFVGDGMDYQKATELYDITTEMINGDSYSFYVSSTSYFPLATIGEVLAVSKFLKGLI